MSDRQGELGTFCSLTPVTDVAGVRGALAGWGEREASPLAALRSAHFARFVLLPALRRETATQPADAVPAPLLMFSAFFDGEAAPFLAALCRELPAEAHAVWRHCAGCPGDPAERPHAFRRWLLDHRVPATAMFGAYTEATVPDVRSALAFREALRAFAFDPERQLAGGAAAFDAFRAFAREHAG